MQKSSFFNSVNGDRKYNASDIAAYFSSFIGNGVYPNPATNLQVSAAAGMNISIAAGKAWINGYYYENTDVFNIAISVADGVLKRIDRVVLRLDHVNRQIALAVLKGVPASNPVAPSLTRTSDVYEIALADILINNGDVSVSQARITDLRMNANLCGIVTGVVEQIDATGLFAQYDTEFYAWFDTIKGALSGDVAGNLAAQITNLAGAGRTNETVKGNADALAAHKADYVAQPANCGTTGGSPTAYTCSSTPNPTALVDKIGAVFTAHADSGANPTLKWGALAAVPLKKPNGAAAVLKKDGVYTARYNATTGNFILQGEGASGDATASDLRSGKTASTDAGDITGNIPTKGNNPTAGYEAIANIASNFSVSGTSLYLKAPKGIYDQDTWIYASEPNWKPENIKKDVSLFGGKMVGTYDAKRHASGPATVDANGMITISGLTFTPSLITIERDSADTNGQASIYNALKSTSNYLYMVGNGYVWAAVSLDGGYVINGGFKLKTGAPSGVSVVYRVFE